MQHLFERPHWRNLPPSPSGVDFSSNDYLGLSRSAELYTCIDEACLQLPEKRNGSTGSRLLTGNSALAIETEALLAHNFNSEATLIFGSGYNANLAVLSALPQRGDTIIYDELAHASLKDGARLSPATRWSFHHNDMDDLRTKLAKASGHKWVVVESLYSMDGTYCPLKEVVRAAKEYGAYTIVDEAHTTGAIGKNGTGLTGFMNICNDVDVRIYTFGKAMGIHGACIAGSAKLVHYLVNYARPFIYTTAPGDHFMVAVREAFAYLSRNMQLQAHLRNVVDEFVRRRNKSAGTFIRSESQIQGLMVPGRERVTAIAGRLKESGFDVRPILSPTVKKGAERIRICLHTYNTAREMDELFSAVDSSY